MNQKRIQHILVLICFVLALPGQAQALWQPDTSVVNATGFVQRTVVQPTDYSGVRIVSTIIKKQSANPSGWGILYIHGFNDYFFQGEMAQGFVSKGYDFYAVDLRKYGRSLLPGQKYTQVRNLVEYFPDIDSAIVDMKRSGVNHIVLMGHSTGGLIAAYYVKKNIADGHFSGKNIDALVLNSPFLDWNLGRLECLVPVISFVGEIFPNIEIKQSGDLYSRSLLKKYNGRWTYNTQWKRVNSTNVDAGWIHAINSAQHFLRKKKNPIELPILLIHSDNSVSGDAWSEKFKHGDAVLDVDDIAKYGRQLGPHVTELIVKGALHDVFLSDPAIVNKTEAYVLNWIGNVKRRSVDK